MWHCTIFKGFRKQPLCTGCATDRHSVSIMLHTCTATFFRLPVCPHWFVAVNTICNHICICMLSCMYRHTPQNLSMPCLLTATRKHPTPPRPGSQSPTATRLSGWAGQYTPATWFRRHPKPPPPLHPTTRPFNPVIGAFLCCCTLHPISRFTITHGNKVEWLGWSLYVGYVPSYGGRLWDIRFKGERMAYELSLQEAMAGGWVCRHEVQAEGDWHASVKQIDTCS